MCAFEKLSDIDYVCSWNYVQTEMSVYEVSSLIVHQQFKGHGSVKSSHIFLHICSLSDVEVMKDASQWSLVGDQLS